MAQIRLPTDTTPPVHGYVVRVTQVKRMQVDLRALGKGQASAAPWPPALTVPRAWPKPSRTRRPLRKAPEHLRKGGTDRCFRPLLPRVDNFRSLSQQCVWRLSGARNLRSKGKASTTTCLRVETTSQHKPTAIAKTGTRGTSIGG